MKKLYIFFMVSMAISVLTFKNSWSQDGENDPTFNSSDKGFGYGSGPNGSIMTVAIQSDGKILMGGTFTSYNGTPRSRIARSNIDGSLDTTFNPGIGANDYIETITLQSDGKILIGGIFKSYNGTVRNKIARLNSDGSLDTSFDPGTGANATIKSIAIQSDGKILIGGWFSMYNGTVRSNIARLNSDGSLDTSFPDKGVYIAIYKIAIQNDGKILIGGYFTYINGIVINRITRLNTDGSLDTSFDVGTGTNHSVQTLSIQDDGKILIGGEFTSFNGTVRNRIARLNSDGSLDTSFDPGSGADNSVYATAIQGDGKILIGGWFSMYNGISRNYIARLNNDGSLDINFDFHGTGVNGRVEAIAVQNDEKILIGGQFSQINETNRNFIARLNSDGSLDTNFDFPGTGANGRVDAIVIQNDGKILIGGGFTSYNGTVRNRIARLNSDGSLDTSFDPGKGANNYVYAIAIQDDGKILIGGRFLNYNATTRNSVARLNNDGSIDTSFYHDMRENSYVSAIAIQNDGKILIGVSSTSINGNGFITSLNNNGSVNTSFGPGSLKNGYIDDIAIQDDGKIIIAGGFSYYNSTERNGIARLNMDGTLDASFNPHWGLNFYFNYIGNIDDITLLRDGKIMIGGSFRAYNGVEINNTARINSNGSLDYDFNPGTGANMYVKTIANQIDGKILIGGPFTSFDGSKRNYIARLNSNGSLDTSFHSGTGANGIVNAIAIQSDGKILIGGEFTSYNGTGRNRIARILSSPTSIDLLPPPLEYNFSIYPNPTKSIVTLTSSFPEGMVEVYSTIGIKVFSTALSGNTIELNLDKLEPGIYMIKLHHPEGVSIGKVILE